MTSFRLLAIAALIALTGCGTKQYCNTVKTEGDDERTIIPDFDSYKIAIFLVPDYQQYIKNDDFLG